MGSIKKALKPITRVVDNIIPNEIKPALPYLAATFGAPYLAGTSLFTSGIGNVALRKGLAGALANVGTQVALGKNVNPVSAAVSGLTVGGGEFLKGFDSKLAKTTGEFLSPGKAGSMSFGDVTAATTAPLTAGTAEAAYDAAKEAEEAYEKYLAEQEAAGNEDIQTRVDFITRYLANAGFDQDYIDTRLNELGYAANGGLMGTRVGYEQGGLEQREKIYSGYLNKLEEKIKDPNLSSSEVETIMDQLKEIRKMLSTGKKDGGIMNLKMGGMPAEMDLRGGGFVPIGAKEKADDVPARLSKNEFVMTADAVRAAGGGSVNKGAKRMYDLMNKLEARV